MIEKVIIKNLYGLHEMTLPRVAMKPASVASMCAIPVGLSKLEPDAVASFNAIKYISKIKEKKISIK